MDDDNTINENVPERSSESDNDSLSCDEDIYQAEESEDDDVHLREGHLVDREDFFSFSI